MAKCEQVMTCRNRNHLFAFAQKGDRRRYSSSTCVNPPQFAACISIEGKEVLTLASEYNPSPRTQQSADVICGIAIFPLQLTGHRIQGANGSLGGRVVRILKAPPPSKGSPA